MSYSPPQNKNIKGRKLKSSLKYISSFAFVSLLVVSFFFRGNYGQKTSAETPKLSKDAYRTAQGLDYRKAMLEQIQKGEMLSFTGKVYFKIENREWVVLVNDNKVYLNFEGKPQIVDYDIIQIFGRYNGTTTYNTVAGSQKEVPSITVDYYKVTVPMK